jgi:hypothetical protein
MIPQLAAVMPVSAFINNTDPLYRMGQDQHLMSANLPQSGNLSATDVDQGSNGKENQTMPATFESPSARAGDAQGNIVPQTGPSTGSAPNHLTRMWQELSILTSKEKPGGYID